MKKIIEVVGAILENPNGDIFCAMRPKDKTFPGMWEFPGGKIEEGEEPKRALEREIKEELNIDIRADKLFDEVQKEYEEFVIKLSTYSCTVLDFSEFRLIEHQEFKWMKKESLMTLDWVPTDIPTVERLINLNKSKKIVNKIIYSEIKELLGTTEIEIEIRPRSIVLNIISGGEWYQKSLKTLPELKVDLERFYVNKLVIDELILKVDEERRKKS
ncbi:(deoxy)nucleoside triphosphate pyrophosphohydrolase [Cetobacterium sp.]|uniref:(deoxy)nucleoside triphosphate pyrophosphohydrolase n=2 Tax=Cetobacterium sp. TaxID=2071632 RepID=UPI0025C06EBD|nr:(deoxy)nucleoside triphosphate pyrophosphohydrolase [Cetobacterium sp.]